VGQPRIGERLHDQRLRPRTAVSPWRWSDAAGWSEVQEDPLRPRSLRPGLAISDLRIEAMRTEGGLRLEFNPHAAQAYDFQISLGQERYIVAGSPLGEVRVHVSP